MYGQLFYSNLMCFYEHQQNNYNYIYHSPVVVGNRSTAFTINFHIIQKNNRCTTINNNSVNKVDFYTVYRKQQIYRLLLTTLNKSMQRTSLLCSQNILPLLITTLNKTRQWFSYYSTQNNRPTAMITL